jgi:hypothetical protein
MLFACLSVVQPSDLQFIVGETRNAKPFLLPEALLSGRSLCSISAYRSIAHRMCDILEDGGCSGLPD